MATGTIPIIANPVSGMGKGLSYLNELVGILESRGVETEVWHTKGRGHASVLARRALDQSVDTLVACGGDGTVHDIAQVLANSDVRLAVAPAGRCNDLARVMGGLPGPAEFADALFTGRPKTLDLARAGGCNFCTVAAVGFDAEVSRRVDQSRLPLKGQPAYMLAVVTALAQYKPAMVRLEWEGGRLESPALLVAVGNTPTYGNAIPIVPPADPTDGLLDACFVRAASFFRVVKLLPTLLKGRHASVPEVSFLRSPWFEIHSDRPLPVWADGEPMAETPIRFEALPGAITLMGNGARPESRP